MEEGGELSKPFVEFYYKSDSLDDPMLLTQWILEFGYATQAELTAMTEYALIINTVVGEFFDSLGITLIDFKVEFGLGRCHCSSRRDYSGRLSVWEKGTNRKLDKDRFRRDLGDVAETYEERRAG